MKNKMMMITMYLAGAGSAFAAAEGNISGTSLATKIFLGFFALIVATQLIPGLIMLAGLLRGLFGKNVKNADLTENVHGRRPS